MRGPHTALLLVMLLVSTVVPASLTSNGRRSRKSKVIPAPGSSASPLSDVCVSVKSVGELRTAIDGMRPISAVQCVKDSLKANKRFRRNGEVLEILGESLEAVGDTDGAIKAYTKAVKLFPGLALCYLKLGNIHTAKGQVRMPPLLHESVCARASVD